MPRRWPFLLCFLLTGCSTHPVADFLDFFRPGKLYTNEVQPYGGVCVNQGAIMPPPTAMPIIGAPVPLSAPPGPATLPSVIPQPVPLPPSTNLQPPPPPATSTVVPALIAAPSVTKRFFAPLAG